MAEITCNDVRAAALQTAPLDAPATAHLARCPDCAREHAGLTALGTQLRARPPAPPAGLTTRTLQRAAPALARNAETVAWRPLLRAVGAALLPLPAIVVASGYGLRVLYGLLATVLPETVSFYLVLNYAGVLALLAALTYGVIPVLAQRQARLANEVAHV